MMFDNLKRFMRRPNRAELERRIKVLTEQRDMLQESVYDLRWSIERLEKARIPHHGAVIQLQSID